MEADRSPHDQFGDQEGTLHSLKRALRDLEPTNAQWWSYGVSHARFALRLYKVDSQWDLMIAALFAADIKGPTSWSDPQLELMFDSPVEHDHLSSNRWTVVDTEHGFHLKASILYWGWDKMYDNSGWYG